jgi:hypothetical protein
MEFRRALTEQTWHLCRNCNQWPHGSFNIIRLDKLPVRFQACNECTRLQQLGKCVDDPEAARDLRRVGRNESQSSK